MEHVWEELLTLCMSRPKKKLSYSNIWFKTSSLIALTKKKLKMPIKVFGYSTSSNDYSKKNRTVFVQTSYWRSNYFESNIEEDFDMKNQFRNKNLPCPLENRDAVCKSYVHSSLRDPSIKRNTADVDFNDKNLDNMRLIQVNDLPDIAQH